MKKIVGFLSLILISGSVFANCNYEEGDDYTSGGKYLWADSCEVHGTVEKVNNKCTKAKVTVNKVTAAFGLRVDAICRFKGTEGAAGDTVWVPID